MTSILSVNSAIPASAFTTTGSHNSVPKSNIRSMDSSGGYSTPPRASDSIMTTLNPMASRASEFQATQVVAAAEEYLFVAEFAPNQQFGNPDITIDKQTGDIYVADYFNNRVIKFDSDGHVITQWGSAGSGDGQFQNPQDVAIDSLGKLYVTDTNNHRIQKFDSNGQFILKWGTHGSGHGQLAFPSRLAFDSNDILYVTEPDNGRVQKFDTNGQFVGTIAEGQLSFPVGIGLDSANNVYVAESGASGNPSRVDKYTSSGSFITSWGSLGTADGQFNQPKGLHVDTENNVFVADQFNNRVQKFDKDGNFITKFDGSMLGHPIDVAVDSMGKVYVSDENNDQILIYELAITTPTIPELIDIINGMGITSSNALINPLQHMCKDLGMFLSKVDSYESSGKLTFEQAEELRQLGTALKNELAC